MGQPAGTSALSCGEGQRWVTWVGDSPWSRSPGVPHHLCRLCVSQGTLFLSGGGVMKTGPSAPRGCVLMSEVLRCWEGNHRQLTLLSLKILSVSVHLGKILLEMSL